MNIPHRTPFFLPLTFPSLTWRVITEAKELYLTFDDGPIPGPTEYCLDTLAKYNVQATFFCIGENVLRNKQLFQRILSAGHAVGNHTFNHVNGWATSAPQYLDNTRRCQDAMEQIAGPLSQPLFRPPYGRITWNEVRLLAKYRIIMWDVLSVDYNKSLSPEKCLRGTINACRPGSIIVFHDSLKAERNMVYALPRLIDHFLTKGFTFKTIAE